VSSSARFQLFGSALEQLSILLGSADSGSSRKKKRKKEKDYCFFSGLLFVIVFTSICPEQPVG
jgi:hypothetical protein